MAATPDKTKWAVLALGGPLSPEAADYLMQDANEADLLVGVDGGARHLDAVGFPPDVVTGDFDSLSERERENLRRGGARLVPTPDQDYTDCDKALRYVLEEGIGTVRLHAGSEGRLDHLYSVLSALVKHSREQGEQADIRLVDEWGETFLCPHPFTLTGDDLPGRTVSFLALGPVEGITTTGVRWPLTNDTLAPGVRDGTLNEITAPVVTVSYATGDLLVMLHHARQRRR